MDDECQEIVKGEKETVGIIPNEEPTSEGVSPSPGYHQDCPGKRIGDREYPEVELSIESTGDGGDHPSDVHSWQGTTKEEPADEICVEPDVYSIVKEEYLGDELPGASELSPQDSAKPGDISIADVNRTEKSCTGESNAHKTSSKKHACNMCDYKGGRARDLLAHIRTHTGEKPYACNLCEYKSNLPNNLKSHMRTHTGEKPFSCSLCDFKTSRQGQIKSHMRTHTGEKPFVCDVCGYRFNQANNLKAHMNTHTGDKPYTCEVCEFKTSTSSHLKIHMRTHTGEKPYACSICDYKASISSHLKTHMRTHTGEKPFECTLCDYKTTVPARLRRHMKIHTRSPKELSATNERDFITLEDII